VEPAARGLGDVGRDPRPARVRDDPRDGDLRRRVRLHVLRLLGAPQIDGPSRAQFHENTTVEIIWTGAPGDHPRALRLAGHQVGDRAEGHQLADLTIKATGIQWKWDYEYIKGEGEGIHFVSTLATPRDQIEGRAPKGEHYLLEVDNEVVVPVGKKVRVLTTAADVVHAWWMPALGVKQDAIPGFIRDIWFRADKVGVLPRPVR
jgi:cytochrome c oxidase subunit 2